MNGMKGVVSGKLESLKSLIPGLSGREGVGLGEVDGEFRLHLSEKVMRGMERMEEIKKEFSEDGKVVILAPMAKSIERLSSLGTLLKSNKYSLAIDDKIGGQELDRLYSFDMTLLEEVDKLDLIVEEIATSDGYDAKVREEIKKLEHFLDEVDELLSKRS
jgi:hypothetical protein